MCTSLSNQLEVAIIDATQPIVRTGFSRWELRHLGIVNDLINCDDTHGPARKAVPDVTGIVYPIGEKLLPATEYPISSVPVPDPERLIEPSFSFKDADKTF
jgi:hypothetical protein